MRNLNKVLALVLAFAMAMSFTFVASASSYSDVTAGTATAKAVDLLSGLGVIGGYPDGTFGPDKTISRAEFLKILFVLTNGTGEESLYAGGSTKYSDVTADKWYASYVNWATQLNIVGGYPDGTFKPDDAVKVSEASKMFVVALGYSASDFTFPYGFIDRAKKSGLFEDVSGVGAEAAAPRGIIALMGSNFLFVPDAPGYSFWNKDLEGGADWDYKTPIEQNFDATENTAIVAGTSNVQPGSITKAGKVSFSDYEGVSGDTTLSSTMDTTFNCDDLIGHAVTVWTNKDDDDKDQIIAIIDDAEQVVTASVDKIAVASSNSGDLKKYDIYTTVDGKNVVLAYADTDSSDKSLIGRYGNEVSGKDLTVTQWFTTEYSDAIDSQTFANTTFNYSATDDSFDGTGFTLLNSKGTALAKTTATYTFIDNDVSSDKADRTTEWDAVYVTYTLTGKVNNVTSDSISIEGINNGGQIDADNIKGGLSTFEEGDYANVTVTQSVVDSSAENVYTITKADVLSGAKVGDVDDTNGTAEFNGTTYKLSAYCTDDLGDLNSGDLIDVVLDKSGYVYHFTTSATVENYMLITDVTESTSSILPNAKVTGLLADGTTQTFTISDDLDSIDINDTEIYSDGDWLSSTGGAATTHDVAAIGQLVIYDTDSDGKIDSMVDPATFMADKDDDNNTSKYSASILDPTGVYKLSSGVIYNADEKNGTYSLDTFATDDTKIFVVDKNDDESNTYSKWDFNVYSGSKMSAFENTPFAFYSVDPDDTDNASVVLISDAIGKSYGTNNILAMRTGAYSITTASDGKTAQLKLELFINGERKTVTSVPVSVSSSSSITDKKKALAKEIFGDSYTTIPSSVSNYFGYADIDSAGQLSAYYEGSERNLDLSNLAVESVTDEYGDVTVNRAAVAKISGSILTVAAVDSDNNALITSNKFASTKLLSVASDATITVIDAVPNYEDNDSDITAASGTLAGLSRSVESSTGDTYIIDFSIREKSNSSGVYEVYQIIAYKQAVER